MPSCRKSPPLSLSLSLSITVTARIHTERYAARTRVYVVPPFSFVAHYAPVNGVRVRVRDSNRHPDHRRHFASVRTVNGERAESGERHEHEHEHEHEYEQEHGRNEPFHDNGNSHRTQTEPPLAPRFFLRCHRPVVSLLADTYSTEKRY